MCGGNEKCFGLVHFDDLSGAHDCDLVAVMRRNAEIGRHDQLLRRDGYYAELHRKQLLEEELQQSV